MHLEEKFRALAGLGAGWVMWLLVGLSVLVVAIGVDRILVLIRTGGPVDALQRGLRLALDRADVRSARLLLVASRTVEARVLLVGLDALALGAAAVEERLAGETQMAKLSLEKRLFVLGTIGANAPFIGLLGTVIGIVRAFRALDASGGQVSTALMAEIGEALTATAIGLFVALPAVIVFNLVQKAIAARVTRTEAMSRDLLAFMKTDASTELSTALTTGGAA